MENIKMIEWKVIKLGDVADIIGGGTPDTKNDSYWGGDVPWLTPKDLSGYGSRHISKGERNISYQGLTNSSAKMLPAGSVLLTSRAPIGYVAIAKNQLCTNQGFKSLVLKENADSEFFYYLLKNNVDYIQGMSSGSTFAEISGSQVKALEFKIPSLDVQKRIAGILGALDDRIDVLRRENVVLEQMAQAVFQSWFVDFDIVRAKAAGTPESEVCEKYHITPELYALFPSALTPDNLPLGWEKLPFSETMKIVSGGTPKTTEAAFWNGNIPWYSVVDAPASVYVLDTEKHITQQGLENSPCSLLKKDTVIISARGTVGKLAMVGKEMAMNQSCYGLEFDFPYYGYLTTKQMLVYLRQNVHGAVFDTITKDTFKTVETVGIPRALQENFTKLVSSFFEKIYKNTQQIRALSATRDALLPKLMNGEIEV